MKRASCHVLVIDDEPQVRSLLRDFLATVANEVTTAASGAEALDILGVFRPDLIIVDMVMPGMSGTEALDAVRRAGLRMPVILISGHVTTMPEGFFAFLRKPFDLRKLSEVVTAAVRHGRTDKA
jgi:two-component system, NtrC family, nitrogen regulation response regulator NtrX